MKNIKTNSTNNNNFRIITTAIFFFITALHSHAQPNSSFKSWAATPPMGWNSYDAYYGCITEKQFKAEVDVLAKKMLPYGYKYAVIDYCWYNGGPDGWNPDQWENFDVDHSRKIFGNKFKGLAMDAYGRLMPAVNRFPSAQSNKGFKPIADYVHKNGMKFGIHIMRGIARDAVQKNLPIYGTSYNAGDIVNIADSCVWNDSMYGIDATKPGAQAYYNSIFNLYAAWGVDFVKVDDIASPVYHKPEIDLIRNAINQCGRSMVLSLSPGDALLGFANHADNTANMYRISNDVWDNWHSILHIFDMANNWSPFIGNGTWPDADMLPIGKLCLTGYPDKNDKGKREHFSFLNYEEQKTMLSLWCMARSPLMWGGSALYSSDSSFTVLTNKEIISIEQNSINNHQLYKPYGRSDFVDYRIWTAESPDKKIKYVALFNLKSEPAQLIFNLDWEFWKGNYNATELWSNKVITLNSNELKSEIIPPHGVMIYKLQY